MRNVLWVREGCIFGTRYDSHLGGEQLCFIEYQENQISQVLYGSSQKSVISAICYSDQVLVQLDGGEIHQSKIIILILVNIVDGKIELGFVKKLNEPFSMLRIAKFDDSEDVFIGLTERGRLYFNSHIVCSDCTSFTLNKDFVLFTDSSHVMHIVPRRYSVKGNN